MIYNMTIQYFRNFGYFLKEKSLTYPNSELCVKCKNIERPKVVNYFRSKRSSIQTSAKRYQFFRSNHPLCPSLFKQRKTSMLLRKLESQSNYVPPSFFSLYSKGFISLFITFFVSMFYDEWMSILDLRITSKLLHLVTEFKTRPD